MSMIMLAVGSVTGNPTRSPRAIGFFNQEHATRSRALGAIEHGSLFDRRDPRWDRDHDARGDEPFRPCARRMKYFSIASVISKSDITPRLERSGSQ